MRIPTRTTAATLAVTGLLAIGPATSNAARVKHECGDKSFIQTGASGATTFTTFAKGIRTKYYDCVLARKLAVSISKEWYSHARLPHGWALVANPATAPDGGQFLIFERDRRHGATQRISFAYYSQSFPTAQPHGQVDAARP